MIVGFGRPSEAALVRIAATVADAEITYDHVGSTLEVGSGRRTRRLEVVVGRGEAVDAATRAAIRAWAGHEALGAVLHPRRPPIAEGTDVMVALAIGPLHIVAPTRIVRVIDDQQRFGFAYGTLPGHPERGEEGFVVERRSDGAVVVSITVDAGPGSALTWLGLPIATALQRRAMRIYATGLARPGRDVTNP